MSYIVVSSAKVIEQCTKHLDRITHRRASMMAAQVYAEAHKKRWFSKPWGYQRAFDALVDVTEDFFDVSITFGANELQCKNLLLLAQNGDPVYVSDDAAWILK